MVLTVAEVRNAQPAERAYKLADGSGLHLYISPSGAKSWRFKYRMFGKEKQLTFGLFPDMSLASGPRKA